MTADDVACDDCWTLGQPCDEHETTKRGDAMTTECDGCGGEGYQTVDTVASDYLHTTVDVPCERCGGDGQVEPFDLSDVLPPETEVQA